MNQKMDKLHKSYQGKMVAIDINECPMCGSHNTMESTQQNGPDDFDYVFECKDCGYNASN